jgi:hypothetical protein
VTYYYKTFVQYFGDLSASLRELARRCKPGSPAAFVVQDSLYKDVHVDLPRCLRSMALACGWTFIDQEDFAVTRMMSLVNTRARKYTDDRAAKESVVFLQTPGV